MNEPKTITLPLTPLLAARLEVRRLEMLEGRKRHQARAGVSLPTEVTSEAAALSALEEGLQRSWDHGMIRGDFDPIQLPRPVMP